MQFHKIALVAWIWRLSALHFVHCLHQPELLSFGDFMEFYLSVPLSCSNVTNAKDVINLFTKTFAACTKEVGSSSPDAFFGNFASICANEQRYFQCWDQLKEDITTNCNQTHYLPGVYAATVKSFCGNDKGNTTINNLRRSMLTMTVADQDNCPEETGIHWIENCKSLLESMISENLCERQNALDKCLAKITCQNFEFGRLPKDIYSGGRAYLNCDS